jgi:hypothetical protein
MSNEQQAKGLIGAESNASHIDHFALMTPRLLERIL